MKQILLAISVIVLLLSFSIEARADATSRRDRCVDRCDNHQQSCNLKCWANLRTAQLCILDCYSDWKDCFSDCQDKYESESEAEDKDD